ncbi:MAG: hypothetical protein ACFFCD_16125 [Promethearchaeota archaeon]
MSQKDIEALTEQMIALAYADNGHTLEQVIEKIFEVLDKYDPKDHFYLIFENLTRDICELYIKNDRSISPILEPLLHDLSRTSRLVLGALNHTVIKWYLKVKGKDDIVELLETDAGKEWMEKNLQEIKDYVLANKND